MSLWIDKKYVGLLSPRVELFKQKSEFLWNFRCPICGDSQKNKLKSRGYVFRKKDSLFYMCHNCGASMSLGNLIKSMDKNLYDQYKFEAYKHGDSNTKVVVDITRNVDMSPPKFDKKRINLSKICDLNKDHPAVTFLHRRKVPEKFYNILYFAPDFKAFIDEIYPKNDKELIERDPRIVIPFYDENNDLFAVQGRTIGSSSIRYITIQLSDDNMKVFGLDRINPNKTVYVVEGPIDSMFLDNCVATADSALTKARLALPDSELVLVYDNEKRNTQIVKQMRRAIESGFNVVVWPEDVAEKDINDMYMAGLEPQSIIYNNTFSGLRAKLELEKWNKV